MRRQLHSVDVGTSTLLCVFNVLHPVMSIAESHERMNHDSLNDECIRDGMGLDVLLGVSGDEVVRSVDSD